MALSDRSNACRCFEERPAEAGSKGCYTLAGLPDFSAADLLCCHIDTAISVQAALCRSAVTRMLALRYGQPAGPDVWQPAVEGAAGDLRDETRPITP